MDRHDLLEQLRAAFLDELCRLMTWEVVDRSMSERRLQLVDADAVGMHIEFRVNDSHRIFAGVLVAEESPACAAEAMAVAVSAELKELAGKGELTSEAVLPGFKRNGA